MEAYASIGKERVSVLLSNIVQTKMSLAVGFASRASIYDAVLTVYELSTAQCIVLALLHGFVNNDVAICSLLGTVSFNVQHLRSSYLKLWLKEDFQFDSGEIYRAFSTAAQYINAGLINVPKHVLQILASIAAMYNVVETCKENGDKDTLELLESLEVSVGGSTVEDDSPAATAKVFIEEKNAGEESSSQAQKEEMSSDRWQLTKRKKNIKFINERNAGEESSSHPEEESSSHPEEERVIQAEQDTQEEPSSSGQAAPLENATTNEEPIQSDAENQDYVPPFLVFSDEDDEDIYDDWTDLDEEYSYETYSDSNVDSVSEDEEALAGGVDSGFYDSTVALQRLNRVDDTGKTQLHKAAEYGSVRAVKMLLQLGYEVDSLDNWRRTPAHLAATAGKLQALRALYHHGSADLVIRDNRGDTILHSAADRGHNEVVRWLIRHNVDVEEAGRGGWRPLHRASQQGHLETVRLLLDEGACPNMMAEVGGTALHRAAFWDKLEVAHLLLARGAIVDSVDNRSDTPLHMAAKLGHLEMVKLLLDCGADAAVEDRSNMTPHDWAERNRRTEVSDYMISRGAAY